jgi:hypothetical protein
LGNFAFDDFARASELIAIGEDAMRSALPALKAKLGIVDKIESPSPAVHVVNAAMAKPSAAEAPA